MGKVTGLRTVFYRTGNRKVAPCPVARHFFMLATVSGQLEHNQTAGPMVGVQGEPEWGLRVFEDTAQQCQVALGDPASQEPTLSCYQLSVIGISFD